MQSDLKAQGRLIAAPEGRKMICYSIEYLFDGYRYRVCVEAKNRESARNKCGRRHKLNAAESKKRIKLLDVFVVGYC